MTDNLLQKLEEKMMMLLAELENLRSETRRLQQENSNLKMEYSSHMQKLQGLISLLDSLDPTTAQQFAAEEVDYAVA